MRLLVFFCACAGLFAQSQLATLSGTVVDTSAAVVPAAAIKLVNVETGEAWSATTNESGSFTVPLVKPGRYRLDVDKTGFKPHAQTGLVLETGGQQRVDVRLEVGSQAERVTVEASASQLQTESATVGAVVENRTIVNMPLINRRAAQLARLTGFVVQVGTGSNFAMGGGRGNNTNWRIDGGNVQNVLVGDQGLNFDPPIESLQEFSVSISNYSAELGRTGGGVVQMTTRSGTNQFQGSAYEYLRNDAFDARTFFAATKTPLRYNLFGVSFSGPIRKDKTHFFFNYEGRRTKSGSTFIHNVPTPAEKTGDFSANPIVIRDPEATGRPPFPGNRIPAGRLDPIGPASPPPIPIPMLPAPQQATPTSAPTARTSIRPTTT